MAKWLQSIAQKIKSLFQKSNSSSPEQAQAPSNSSNESAPLDEAVPWVSIALKELGVKEIRGEKDNPRIVEYHQSCSLNAKDDETSWCSAFVTWCLEKSGHASTKSAWARSYLNYGEKLVYPKYGCIVIFDRGNGFGHVGFCIGETNESIKLLAGNQGDAVSIEWKPRHKVLGYRWPVMK